MDLRKYSVSEFSEMLENEMKLNKEKCEKIAKYYEMKRDIKNDLEITYKIVAPVEKNVYYRRPLEMAYNYESTLWGMKEAQISSFTGVKNKEYFVNTKLATTSSTGGLLLALQRAIVTIRPKGRYRKHFCWPAIKRYYSNLLVSILLLALLYTFELLHLLYCQSFQHNIL